MIELVEQLLFACFLCAQLHPSMITTGFHFCFLDWRVSKDVVDSFTMESLLGSNVSWMILSNTWFT